MAIENLVGEMTSGQNMPPAYWPEFSRPEHKGLVYLPAPHLVHMRNMFPPVAVQADLERYRERHAQLVPFSSDEKELASRELYERDSGLQRKIKSPGVRANRIYELTGKVLDIIDENYNKLTTLRTVYNPEKNFFQSPDNIKADRSVLDVLIACTEAAQTAILGDWDEIEKEDEKMRQTRWQEIEEYITNLDSVQLIKFCSSNMGILESRRDFWGIELATVLTHKAIFELDEYIGAHDYSNELDEAV